MHPIALPDRMCQSFELEQPTGVIILSVEEGSPADESGVVLGDILVAIGGKPVRETEDVLILLGANAVGSELDTRVLRGGSPIELRLRVGERPRR
jgi:S1-C subfamily serine protease